MYRPIPRFAASYQNPRCSQTHVRLLPLQLLLHDTKCHIKHIKLLLHMRTLQACRNAGAWIATSVHDVLTIMVLSLVQKCLDTRLREAPCACIQRFFLSPDNGLGIGVLIKVFLELSPREGVKLFDTGDCGLVVLVLSTVFVKSDINLPRTEDDTVNLFWRSNIVSLVSWIRNDPLEM